MMRRVLITAALLLMAATSAAYAMGWGFGWGWNDHIAFGGKAGPQPVPSFLKLEGTGFILLEGGGKLKCESC